MNRFIKIFETALNNSNPEVTKADVDDVMQGMGKEAISPGSLTSGDSTLVPLRDDEGEAEEMSEDSTTGAVAGFNSQKAFQPTTDKLVMARMYADAIAKACEFGNDELNTTDDNLEELRKVSPRERRRLRQYGRRHERFGRDPLGTEGLKPDKI